jgi:hypothetical protein
LLAGSFLLVRWVTRSRFGRVLVAVRDNETRLYFLGYRPDLYKAFAFIGAALLAALGGMLYAPQNGIITPNAMRVESSIWMVIWVAVGGRGRLWGAVVGALLANFTYSALTADVPTAWPFLQAGLFLGALAFPNGVSDLWTKLEGEIRQGSRVFRILLALAFIEVALIADKLHWIPSLGGFAILGVQSKYWILIAITIVLCIGRVAHASIPMLGLGWFLLTEALGLMPRSFSILKYLLVLASILAYAYLEGNLTSGVKSITGKFRRSRPKSEAAPVGNTP